MATGFPKRCTEPPLPPRPEFPVWPLPSAVNEQAGDWAGLCQSGAANPEARRHCECWPCRDYVRYVHGLLAAEQRGARDVVERMALRLGAGVEPVEPEPPITR